MPVLARTFESAGMATIMVTNMPIWAEKIGVPRTLAVEYPFGHILGQPDQPNQQMRVIRKALTALVEAEQPGTITHFQEKWPSSLEEAIRASHPPEPPPIMASMAKNIREFLAGMRRGRT